MWLMDVPDGPEHATTARQSVITTITERIFVVLSVFPGLPMLTPGSPDHQTLRY